MDSGHEGDDDSFVEQHRKRVQRKKASVEAMLKTAVQSQLEGVRTGILLLAAARDDVNDIQKKLDEADTIYQDLSKLAVQLQDVREESFRHSQTGTLMEHLKHIFNVPGSITRTQDLIQDGNLLLAHKALSDLECSRDELLYELHKQANNQASDRAMLKQYFADVERLSDELAKQLWLILKRTLNTVRKEPQVIVTALRLIMREEWADEAALKRQQSTGFLPPGRPKLWRKKAIETLEQSVAERLEGNQIEVRSENNMWLVRHLEVTRQLIIEDLKTVKHHCTPCFPPCFDIFNEWVRMTHNCLSQRLQTIISQGLVDSEYIHVLQWLNTYNSRDLMGHPDLHVDVSRYEALLPDSTIERLMERYLAGLRTKFEEWLRNALSTDHKDWQKNEMPEQDSNGYYRTETPMLIYQMITQHVEVARTVSLDLVSRVLRLAMNRMDYFLSQYNQLVTDYKTKNFEDRVAGNLLGHFTSIAVPITLNDRALLYRERSLFQSYTAYMIAIANNAVNMETLLTKLSDGEPLGMGLADKLRELKDNSLDYLCEEVLTDIKVLMPDIMTRKWLTREAQTIETVTVTLADYGGDYTALIEYHTLIGKIEKEVAASYVKAICEKRMSFRNYEERRAAAELILSDTEKLKKQFADLYKKKPLGEEKEEESKLDVLKLMAEVLKMKDSSLLSLEMNGLVKKFPEVSADELLSLLDLRGDISRVDARQLIIDLKPGAATDRNIFSNLLPL
ncbi:exocyst complex component 3-like isoform X2 [Varroa jacobsoni]|uniref:exocyst complex component 3-like isoform X2 n=1 Tax=Varroa jacobsoni TaxID=62625 RepID=UPI000BF77243|nr:exocyst complex component 3-like isoform X2 [Varroa jacobsoni]